MLVEAVFRLVIMLHDSVRPLGDLATQVSAAWPVEAWSAVNVLVAVSGGADSVALLRALLDLKSSAGGGGRIIVAHFNHALRGAESDADQAWLQATCDQLAIPLITGRGDCGGSSEQAARQARYRFLEQAAGQCGARFVALGHTADDQAETVLFRLLRGSGLAGLAGIPFSRPLCEAVTIVRPLLRTTRSQVEQFLAESSQEYRHDGTNDNLEYRRNWIRHELLPLACQHMGTQVPAVLAGLATQAEEAQLVVSELARAVLAKAFATSGPSQLVTVDVDQLAGEPPLIVREAFRLAWRSNGWGEQALGRADWEQLATLATSGASSQTVMLPHGIRAQRRGSVLTLKSTSLP